MPARPSEGHLDHRLTDDRYPAALLDVLTDRLEDYEATVFRCAPFGVAATVGHALRTALREHDAAPVVVAPGVPTGRRPDGAVEDDDRPAVALVGHAATVTGLLVVRCVPCGPHIRRGGSESGAQIHGGSGRGAFGSGDGSS